MIAAGAVVVMGIGAIVFWRFTRTDPQPAITPVAVSSPAVVGTPPTSIGGPTLPQLDPTPIVSAVASATSSMIPVTTAAPIVTKKIVAPKPSASVAPSTAPATTSTNPMNIKLK